MAFEFDPKNKELAEFVWKCFIRAYKYQGWAIMLDEKYQEERLDICRGCEQFDKQKFQCKACGCPLASKSLYGHESCPLDKWTDDNRTFVNEKFEHMSRYIYKDMPTKDGTDAPVFPKDSNEGDLFTWNFFWWQYRHGEWVSIEDPLRDVDN